MSKESLSCHDMLADKICELEECLELSEAHSSELEDEVKAGDDCITELEHTVEHLECDIENLEEKICELEEELEQEKNKEIIIGSESYDNLIELYYHDDFSMQQLFDRLGRKAVEVEFYKYMNRQ